MNCPVCGKEGMLPHYRRIIPNPTWEKARELVAYVCDNGHEVEQVTEGGKVINERLVRG